MIWHYAFTKKAQKQLNKLDNKTQSRIKQAVYTKLIIDPKQHLIALSGNKAGLYKFRVGDYRLLCNKKDNELCILVIKVKHRKEVYKH